MTLDELEIGREAVIRTVGGEGALRCRLLDMGLIPKTKIFIRKTAPMGDPIEIYIRGYSLSIRLDDAKKIGIEPIDSSDKEESPAKGAENAHTARQKEVSKR